MDLLTVKEVAQDLHVSDETVYRYIHDGKLRAYRFGGLWRIPADALDEFVAKASGPKGESDNVREQ